MHDIPHKEAKMTNFATFSPHLAAVADMLESVFMPKWGEMLVFKPFLPPVGEILHFKVAPLVSYANISSHSDFVLIR